MILTTIIVAILAGLSLSHVVGAMPPENGNPPARLNGFHPRENADLLLYPRVSSETEPPTILAAATLGAPTASTSVPNIPQPKQDWHGLRRPNYTEMYLNYTEPVHCIRVSKPIGFYGYANWLSSCLILALTVANTVTLPPPRLSKLLSDVSGVVFFVVSLVRTTKAYRGCAEEVQRGGGSWFVVEGETVTYAHKAFAGNFLFVPWVMDMISLLTVFVNCAFYACLFASRTWPLVVVCVVNVLAFLAAFLVSFLFYQEYTLFLYADDVIGAQIGCVVASIVVLLAMLPWYLRRKFGKYLAGAVWESGLTWLVLACVVFHTLCVGISYVLLGRTINDPWGLTSCTGPLGVLQAVLDGVVPVFAFIMSVLHGSESGA